MIKLTFLGTGGAFSDFRVNYHTNALLHTKQGYVMIDCGPTAPQALKELGIKPWEIRSIILTHLHGDHIGGIEQLAWERFYLGEGTPGFLDTKIYAAPEVLQPLRGILEPCLDEYTRSDGSCRHGGYDRLITELPLYSEMMEAFTSPEGLMFRLHLTKVSHVEDVNNGVNKPSYGLIIQQGNSRIFYSGDCIFDASTFVQDSSVIFHDCSFGAKYPGTVHTHYSALRDLPADIRKKIVLMHYTAVPKDISPEQEGFRVAKRFDTWMIDDSGISMQPFAKPLL